jgi:hypothetical protein
MTAPSQDLIDRLAAAALDAREAAREAHEARRDLRQAEKDAKAVIAEMAQAVSARAEALIGAEVGRQLDAMSLPAAEAGESLRSAHKDWIDHLDEAIGVIKAIGLWAEQNGIPLRPLAAPDSIEARRRRSRARR